MRAALSAQLGYVVGATLLALWVCASGTQDVKVEDLKAEIVPNCILAVGEWGTEMVDHCVKEQGAALDAVIQYRTRDRDSVARCTGRWKRNGWTEVKACVEHDLQASAALVEYRKQHEALVATCQAQASHKGPAAIRACVEEALGPHPAGR